MTDVTIHSEQSRYLALGLALVFWARQPDPENDWKGPREEGWQTKPPALLADYRDNMQVGGKTGVEIAPGRFLFDADFDWVPGIAFAGRFLPTTGFVFGRASKPRGHCFYTTSASVTYKKFEDVDGITIVERRGTKADGTIGYQTMLPPSVHRASGEVVTFASDGDIAHNDAAVEGVTLYAVACVLGRHWPTNGPLTNQHDCAAYAAGFLCRQGVNPDVVLDIVEVAATLGGDANVRDRVRYARDTVRKFRAGDKKLAGGPKLAKEIGDDVVALLREWLPKPDAVPTDIARLNQRFAIVSVGNKVVVMETEPDGSIATLWPFEEFKRLLVKERIEIESETPTGRTTTKIVNLADLWLHHKDGRRYERLVYAMPGSDERKRQDDYNGYLGFTVTPTPGDWSKNRDHLKHIICGGDGMLFIWLLNWMAALAQFPGRHAFTAVVLRGGQGIGKGHFAHLMLGALFYKQQYLHIIGAGMLTGRFNEHLSGKVLVFADESTWGGDPAAADKLKGMVTESTIPVERKYLPIIEEPSALHIVIASNNEWPIAIPMDDRRFQVFDVAEDEKQNDDYFTPLRAELANGGLAAMLHDLLEHPINEWALRHPLSTKGKREIMALSLTPIQRWWYDKLLTGALSFNVIDKNGGVTTVEGWPADVEKAALHEDYLAFLDKHRDTRTRRSTETELGMFLSKYAPMRTQRRLPGTKASRAEAEKTKSFWTLPSLAECRAFWARACGWPDDFDWDEGS